MFKKFNPIFYITLFFCNFVNPVSYPIAWADEIQAAVATNFYNPFKTVVKQFENKTGHKVIIITGSTGKLYAQIVNGAPFDVFLSADSLRPKLLMQNGRAVSGTQYSYAFGKITLWSPNPNVILESVKSTLLKSKFSHIAIANPTTAPYGKATLQALERIGQWDRLKPLLVQGENIGQTFQFVFSENAELGFVALSQVLDPKNNQKGKRVEIPSDYYNPIKQDIVILTRGKHNTGAMALWQFLRGDQAKRVIKKYGYELP
jgi:molybdate transport system substrate-binding protein